MNKYYYLLMLGLGVAGIGNAQVGIGTANPNSSSQLEVIASDKGILIPRVPLTSSIDAVTITNGNVESLLLFNTATVADITPGYYYWYDNKWQRMVASADIPNNIVIWNPITNEFTYIDASGNTQVINIEQIVQDNETVTTLVNNNDGTYTYTSEDGTVTTINVPADVINNFTDIVSNTDVLNELIEIIHENGGNVYYDGTQFTYIDASGNTQVINIQDLVQANETLTTATFDPATGILTYTDEDGVANNLDLGAMVPNFETLTSISQDAAAGTITYVDENGASTVLSIAALIAQHETLTSATFDAATGILTYNDENGVANALNLSTMVPNFETLTSISQDVVAGTITYVDENGASTVLDIATLIAQHETITTLTQGTGVNAGTYTYTNEAGVTTTFNVTQTGNGAPTGSATAGDVYVDTTTGAIYTYNGTTWVQQGADLTNDAWINNPANTRVELGTLSDGTTARTAGTEFVALDNGNVGIGTNMPNTTMEIVSKQSNSAIHPYRNGLLVSGEGSDVGGRVGVRHASPSAGGPWFLGYASRGALTAPAATLQNDLLLGIGASAYNGTAYAAGSETNIRMFASENFTATANGTYMSFKTVPDGTVLGTEKMRITALGNIGINIPAPTNKLHVAATTDPVRLEGLQTGAATDNIVVADATGVLKTVDAASIANSTEPWFNQATNAGATANTQNIYQMGKVRIGTISNNGISKLAIYSEANELGISIVDTLATNKINAGMISSAFRWADGTIGRYALSGSSDPSAPGIQNAFRIQVNTDESAAQPWFNPMLATKSRDVLLNAVQNGSSSHMIIKSTGNVGINAATPTNKLHVAATTNPVRFEGLQTGAVTDKIVVADATGVLKTVDASTLATAETNTTLEFDATTGELTYTNEENNNPVIDLSTLKIEPWQVESTTDKATTNVQNIYQNANVGIGDFAAANPITNLDVRGAVRVGTPHADEISGASPIGANSAAFGQLNIVSAAVSLATGSNNTVSGTASFASGYNNTVTNIGNGAFGLANTVEGQASFAAGQNNIISGFGAFANAFGSNNTLNGPLSFVAGADNTTSNGATNSAAFGSGNAINAMSSFAAGSNNTINFNNGIALGNNNTTSGPNYSIAMGRDNIVSGDAAAIGYRNNVAGNFAIGIGDNNELANSALYAAAIGRDNGVTGEYAIAIGNNNDSDGQYAAAIGSGNTSSGEYAMTLGQNNTASGTYALAAGLGSQATGTGSVVVAENGTSTGNYAVAVGSDVHSTGDFSAVVGSGSTASGNYAASVGQNNTASGAFSATVGLENTSTGNFSAAIGHNLTVASNVELAGGRFNAITTGDAANWVATDALVQIGVGVDDANRANALTILKNGNIGTDLAIAPTERIDIGSGNVRVRDINANTGAATDKIVVADANGVLKTVDAINTSVSSIIKITADYTALATDYTILANATSGGFTVTLPTAASSTGRFLIIRKTDETANILTFSQPIRISETTSFTTLNINTTIRIQSDGTDWYKID